MSILLLLHTVAFLFQLSVSKERDIYHVITGEPDTHHKKSLDPVYYVGVYDKKPRFTPANYGIEIMTSDSGKRFTCLIPSDDTKEETNPQSTNNQSDEDDDIPPIHSSQSTNIGQSDLGLYGDTDPELLDTDDTDLEDNEPAKTSEELMQEVDTLELRISYLQEVIIYNKNQAKAKAQKKSKRKSNRNKDNKPCYYNRDGYWNYEVCLFGQINQFHGNKNKRDPNIKLGKYATYADVPRILMADQSYTYSYIVDIYGLDLFKSSDNFIHLLYTNGDKKRKTLVTIKCPKVAKKSFDGIISIKEPKVHHYHITFLYSSVCNYQRWVKQEFNIPDDSDSDDMDDLNGDSEIDNELFDTSSSALLASMDIDPNSDDIALLLSPLLKQSNNNICLLLKQGWWTVEFCYAKYMRQIHLEPKQEKGQIQITNNLNEWDIKAEHVLGTWNELTVIDQNSYVIHKNENDPERTYASIVYDNGDPCDLTNKPRKTEIQFRCGLNMERSELLKSREDPSCEYIAEIETPLLCGHPDFKIPSAPNFEIVCYPFDEKEFVDDASSMKQAIDLQSETDSILNIVRNIALQQNQEISNIDNEKIEEEQFDSEIDISNENIHKNEL